MTSSNLIQKLRSHVSDLWWYTLLMFICSRVGDLIQLVIGLFIVPDHIPQEELGAILPLTNLTIFVALPLTMLMTVGLKFSSVFEARGEPGKVKSLMQILIRLVAGLSLAVFLLVWTGRDLIQSTLHFQRPELIAVIGLSAMVSCWLPLATSLNQGLRNFKVLILVKVAGPVTRLIVIVATISWLGVTSYFLATLALQCTVLAFLLKALFRFVHRDIPAVSFRPHMSEMVRFLVPASAAALLITLQATLEPSVIRNHLSPEDSAGYFIAAMFGLIPSYIAPAVSVFLFPLASRKHERGESTQRMHFQALAFVLLVGVSITGSLALLGPWLLTLRESWAVYSGYGHYIWQISLVVTCKCLITTHITHENACRNFRYLWIVAPMLAAECLAVALLLSNAFAAGLTLQSMLLVMMLTGGFTVAALSLKMSRSYRPVNTRTPD